MASGVARMLEKSKETLAENKPNPNDFCNVFILKNPVSEGKEVLPENIIVAQHHKNEVPRNAVKTYKQIDGRATKSEISKGTVLLDEYFLPQITTSTVNGFIPPGFHSVTVQIHEVAANGQSSIDAVYPGDQVDIIIVPQNTEKGDVLDEFVLLEKIPVIDTFWNVTGDSQRIEKKGTVSLLLSDSQRKNLEEEYSSAMKIRLRVCSPAGTHTADRSQPQTPAILIGSRNFYQTGNLPPLLSQSLQNDTSPIEIVFRNKELKSISHNELQIPSIRGIPVENYADGNVDIARVSAFEKQKPVDLPGLSPSLPRYSSFFDAADQKTNGNTQWRAVVPRSPLVFEARPNLDMQVRGIYRYGGVYYSVD